MKKMFGLLFGAVLLNACIPQEELNGVSTDAARYQYEGEFRTIPTVRRLWQNPDDVVQFYLEGSEAGDIEIRKMKTDRGLLLLMTAIGYADDSVGGEQWRIMLNGTEGTWGITTAEKRFLCQRGPNAGQWVATLCP